METILASMLAAQGLVAGLVAVAVIRRSRGERALRRQLAAAVQTAQWRVERAEAREGHAMVRERKAKGELERLCDSLAGWAETNHPKDPRGRG